MEAQKSLSKLAIRLRVLRPAEKRTYLTELDEHAKDHYMQMSSGQLMNPFSLQSLACSIYYSLEGTPYIQPESVSETKIKDIVARKKFNAIFSGVVAYTRAPDKDKDAFKKSVFKIPNTISKISYLIKMHQNRMV